MKSSEEILDGSNSSLASFFRTEAGAESDAYLAELIEKHGMPTIKSIIRSKLRVSLRSDDSSRDNQDALEIVGDVQTVLVAHLRALRARDGGKGIDNFRNYAATVAYNSCHEYLRRKYPIRYQTKYKLRYLLTHEKRFSLMKAPDGVWVAALAAGKTAAAYLGEVPEPIIEELKPAFSAVAAGRSERALTFSLLEAIFERSGSPIEFDCLVSIVCAIRGLKDISNVSPDDGPVKDNLDGIRDPDQNFAGIVEDREVLTMLWSEVCKLPVRHRAALLLNLKDPSGESTIGFLPILRIATIRRIAEVLEIDPLEFATVWNSLPWDDLKIAGFLGIKRQDVINLRRSARSMLSRVMKDTRRG